MIGRSAAVSTARSAGTWARRHPSFADRAPASARRAASRRSRHLGRCLNQCAWRSPTTSAASCPSSSRTGARGEVLTLAYANARGARSARARPASCTSGAARATSCGTRARRRATPRRCARCASTATATRCSRSSSRPGPPATPASARASSTGELEPPAPHEALPASSARSPTRAAERPEGSYTVTLLDDPPLIGEKVQEEAEEVARAAREETDERVDDEAADVLYHLTVLLHSRGRAPRRRRAAAARAPR